MKLPILTLSFIILSLNQGFPQPQISEENEELAVILGSISDEYSESYFLYDVSAFFVTDYYSHAGIKGIDSDYLHILYISVAQRGDPPSFRLYKVSPFYLPSFKGFIPKTGADNVNEIYGIEVEYQDGDERRTCTIKFNFHFARIE